MSKLFTPTLFFSKSTPARRASTRCKLAASFARREESAWALTCRHTTTLLTDNAAGLGRHTVMAHIVTVSCLRINPTERSVQRVSLVLDNMPSPGVYDTIRTVAGWEKVMPLHYPLFGGVLCPNLPPDQNWNTVAPYTVKAARNGGAWKVWLDDNVAADRVGLPAFSVAGSCYFYGTGYLVAYAKDLTLLPTPSVEDARVLWHTGDADPAHAAKLDTDMHVRFNPNGSVGFALESHDKTFVCSRCGENCKRLLCSACKQVDYCGPTCQTLDWKAHKLVCKPAGA